MGTHGVFHRLLNQSESTSGDRTDRDIGDVEATAGHELHGEGQRVDKLVAGGAVSRADHQRRRTQRDVAKASLDAARKRFDDTVLRSPFAGIVAAVHVEAFQNVGAQQPVATLQTTGAAEAVVQVPATLVANSERIEPLETVVVLDAAPGAPMPATLHSTAARADPAAQTFELRFAFTPPEGVVILPGMTGNPRATLAMATEDGAAHISVPISAILSEAEARYVWVVDPDSMTVSKREVVLGDGAGETLPVERGLAAGEIIVAAGVSYLHEGMQASSRDSSPPPPPRRSSSTTGCPRAPTSPAPATT